MTLDGRSRLVAFLQKYFEFGAHIKMADRTKTIASGKNCLSQNELSNLEIQIFNRAKVTILSVEIFRAN